VTLGGCKDDKAANPAEPGKKAPDFTLKNYDGKRIRLADYRGKIVVLEWFNYGCPFSRYHYETVKTMAGVAGRYKAKDVVWLAINSTKHLEVEKHKEFAKSNEVGYPILDDSSGKVGRAYGAETTPHMFIIDKKGNIVYDGAIDDSPQGRKKQNVTNYVDKALAEVIAGKAVTIPDTKPYGCTVKYAQAAQ
jgi:peroxiredoxin